MRILILAALLQSVFASGARAEWRAADAKVAEAAAHPRVAAALDAVDRIDAAIIAGDARAFMAAFSRDTVVNSPFNIIADRDEAERRFASGLLSYRSLNRIIEYAAPRGEDEVILMGEEIYEPAGAHPLAGKIVRRRFTDLWRLEDGDWTIALRQATVIAVE